MCPVSNALSELLFEKCTELTTFEADTIKYSNKFSWRPVHLPKLESVSIEIGVSQETEGNLLGFLECNRQLRKVKLHINLSDKEAMSLSKIIARLGHLEILHLRGYWKHFPSFTPMNTLRKLILSDLSEISAIQISESFGTGRNSSGSLEGAIY